MNQTKNKIFLLNVGRGGAHFERGVIPEFGGRVNDYYTQANQRRILGNDFISGQSVLGNFEIIFLNF